MVSRLDIEHWDAMAGMVPSKLSEEAPEEPAIDIDEDEFFSQLAYEGGVAGHLEYEVDSHPGVDPDRVRNAMAELALNEMNEEREYAEQAAQEIERLRERIAELSSDRRRALRRAQLLDEAHTELIV